MSPRAAAFPRSQRIRRSQEFREVSRRGERHATEAFVVLAAPTDAAAAPAPASPEAARPTLAPPAPARLGITVSRKVGNAVVRNRIKRRVREWFRREGRDAARGLDLVVIARPPAARLASDETHAQLRRLLGRRR